MKVNPDGSIELNPLEACGLHEVLVALDALRKVNIADADKAPKHPTETNRLQGLRNYAHSVGGFGLDKLVNGTAIACKVCGHAYSIEQIAAGDTSYCARCSGDVEDL